METEEFSTVAKSSKQMGAKEVRKTSKSFKPTFSIQEASTTPSQPDWFGMQAYYGSGIHPSPVHGFNGVSPPTVYPYTRGNQQNSMHPYASLLQYQAIYHQKRSYANTDAVEVATYTISEREENHPNEKGLDLVEKCKGSSKNMVLPSNRSRESGNAASGGRNDGDGASQSAVNGSEGSSDGSDEINQGLSATKKQRFNPMHINGAAGKDDVTIHHFGAHPDSMLQDPAVNMDEALGAVAQQVKDELELRKERRRQSNRESARRSKLRRKQECEKLQSAVEVLRTESSMLTNELHKLSEECGKLDYENKCIMKELNEMYGPDAISNLITAEPDSDNSESNSDEEPSPNENSSNSDQNRNSSLLQFEAGSWF
ncbi:bZIP_1 domain-containing protein/MFMR domain-containing protein [Cephalotus follicularis]|uniref:BZIP_1 domain-containing protein/MFMR domain-containing protein n=1 Tax=Cephalotus follicularis TaxID=3775 RepID=A0A1Q3C9L7_CEPFO|nr:bZIP_1 domain-containing protein/MFMR domain-containing protein [Cephalotus follicularis]